MCGPVNNTFPHEVTAYSSAARTETPTAATVVNQGNFNACLIFVSATDETATASVVFNFDIYNYKAGTWVEVLESAAVEAVSENVYMLGASAAVANVATVIPPTSKIRIRPVHADSDSLTYSVAVRWLWL